MPFVVVYDANVLYPNLMRDLLIRIARQGLVQAKWSERILDETFDSLRRNRPELPADRLLRTRELMVKAVADCLVHDYEALVEAVDLPDPDDRHVLAVAIKAHAQVIVTNNLRDFPAKELDRWDIEAKSPDAFVSDQIHLDRAVVYAEVTRIADSRVNPRQTVSDVLDKLDALGLVSSAALLRRS